MNGRLHDTFYVARECGHRSGPRGGERCSKPAAYEFYLKQWPDIPGLACVEHVRNIRGWSNLVRVQSLRSPIAPLAGISGSLGMAVGTEKA